MKSEHFVIKYNLRNRIIQLLKEHPQGLTAREMGERLNKPKTSLTYAIKSLQDKRIIVVSSQWYYHDTHRYNSVYSLKSQVNG